MSKPQYYETLYVLRPDVDDAEKDSLMEKISSAVAKHSGEVMKSDVWAERTLAYKIENYSKGTYYILIYKALPEVVVELEKVFRGARTDVLRFITVKTDEASAAKAAGIETVSGADSDKKKKKKEKNLVVRKKYGRYKFENLKPADIDYKNIDLIRSFVTERKKIVPRRTSGLSAYGQRLLSNAIKRARMMALLPFTVLHK